MQKSMLHKGEEMLFALLRASLHNIAAEELPFKDATPQDWEKCYNTAVKQGVLALAWDGLETLPKELHPQKPLKFRWGISVGKYEEKHRRYCKTAEELQKYYHGHGIDTVQMKGVGLSASYNKPAHREGGDIDIYTFSADENSMSHSQANALADKLMQDQGNDVELHSYKHSNFYFKGIPIENHKCFVNIKVNPTFMKKLNRLLLERLKPRMAALLDGECRIKVPSQEFNTIFISTHALQHYGTGIALHHLYDWATVIKENGLNLPKEITETYYLSGVAALTHLANRHLGTKIGLDNFPCNYLPLADEILEEMLHPEFSVTVPYTNPIKIFAYKTRRFISYNRKMKMVFGASLPKQIWGSILSHIKNPATIFDRGEK